jgi:hypothetical protein
VRPNVSLHIPQPWPYQSGDSVCPASGRCQHIPKYQPRRTPSLILKPDSLTNSPFFQAFAFSLYISEEDKPRCQSPRQHIILRLPPTCPAEHQHIINTARKSLRLSQYLIGSPDSPQFLHQVYKLSLPEGHLRTTKYYTKSATSTTTFYHHATIKMLASTASAFNPRQRLSILTNSTLGHDVSAAFKASTTIASRSSAVNETPAPPPSPVDFSFPSTPADSRRGSSN